MSVDGQPQCSTHHRGFQARKRPLLKTMVNAAGRWLVTFGIVVCLFAVLHFYSERLPIMNSRTERELNTIITGLSIALSLSNAMAFSAIISPLRWWILSRRHFSARKVGHRNRGGNTFAERLSSDRCNCSGRYSQGCSRIGNEDTAIHDPSCCDTVACLDDCKRMNLPKRFRALELMLLSYVRLRLLSSAYVSRSIELMAQP